MLSVIGGPDERDMTAWNTPTPDYRSGSPRWRARLRGRLEHGSLWCK